MILFEINVDEEVAQIVLSINVFVEKTQKHISENNLNFTNVFSLMESLCKEIKISYLEVWNPNSFSDKSGTLKVEIHICPAPTVYPDLVRKLGDFCYRSSKEFDTSVETRCV
jgi:hypothetical protein